MPDYVYLRAWNRYMGSLSEEWMLSEAREDKAPADAIYKRDGRWIRYAEVAPHAPCRPFIDAKVIEIMHRKENS